jgi:hypothetical protein
MNQTILTFRRASPDDLDFIADCNYTASSPSPSSASIISINFWEQKNLDSGYLSHKSDRIPHNNPVARRPYQVGQ